MVHSGAFCTVALSVSGGAYVTVAYGQLWHGMYQYAGSESYYCHTDGTASVATIHNEGDDRIDVSTSGYTFTFAIQMSTDANWDQQIVVTCSGAGVHNGPRSGFTYVNLIN